ncbi:efflux RND transporter periplasmic adaptor subunit [Parvularcula maris]|uniref:Efflux RND transporter periplasmic adaptor subunit n=1 Tax=Parvularcula maris TaxID=2965077 RepID=A0A9X2L7G7_9PROT|nr:efflux RND transporter periplasmic adaptor subunit [Parvularcula maris]MCQ8184489.1 efflux RND transporter periplasmic adaptor subunit [Parvularcula maris]
MYRSLLLTLLLLAAACGGGGEPASGQADALPVRTQKPEAREVVLWDEYIGRFEAVERAELRPRVSGYLEEVHFEDGAMVEEGQLLFTIDQRPFQATLDQARSSFEQVRTNQRLADAELSRAKQLLDARAGSQEEYDRALQARDAARASLAGAEAEVRRAQLDMGFTEVKAPISGRIGQRRIDRGNLITAGETVLTTIVAVDPIHFTFTGTEGDYLNYVRLARQGNRPSSRDAPNPVQIKIEGAESYDVRGEMDFVDNEIDASTGTIVGRAIVRNEESILTPGMFGEMRLYGRDPFEAMVIPDRAVQFDQDKQFVWVIGEDGNSAMRFVELGRLLGDNMRIIDGGLEADADVIVGGFTNLRPGTPVVSKAPEEQPASVAQASEQ